MDISTLVGAAIRNKLIADASILAYVDQRILQFAAPGTATMPYITFSHSAGGYLNNTPKDAFDAEFLITAVAPTQPQARAVSDLINDALHRQYVNYNDGWNSWSRIQMVMPFMDLANIQNVQYWRVGGFYRFRGIKE